MIKASFILLIFFLSFIEPKTEDFNEFIFPKDVDYEEYKNTCKENIYINHEKCYYNSGMFDSIISKSLSSIDLTSLKENDKEKIAFVYYNLGNIFYHGFLTNEPNLDKGLANFIISSFFGSPQSKYKLSIIISNDIFEQIYNGKGFQTLLNSMDLLKKIRKTEFFINNFEYLMNMYNLQKRENSNDKNVQNLKEFKNNLAISFLYSAALQNYPPAKKVMAYKLNKGYGVSFSCTSALKYYEELSKDTLKELSEINNKLYYEYQKIEKFEYIGTKFDEDNLKDEKQIIELYWSQITGKKNSENLQIIKELAKMYYYGSAGVEQNYKTSLDLYLKAEKLNDTEALYYIGEHYLNGWGTEQNYTKAYEYFKKSISYNTTETSKSWNSLGYLYYYGLGVKKDVKKAYDYFVVGAKSGDESAIYDSAYLLIENYKKDKKLIEKDVSKAYEYATKLASSNFNFGTYLYAMMNQYSMGSTVKSCDVNIKFFISICEKNLYTKYLYDLAFKYYKNKMYRKAFLLYLELSEGGSEKAQINTALLLDNYHIFIDKDFQKFLTYKFYYMSYLTGNTIASLKLGDFYYKGFGNIPEDSEKSIKYYKESKGAELVADPFKLSNADFNLGMLHLFRENSTNITDDIYQSDIYFNSSETLEPLTHYPIKIAKFYFKYFYHKKGNKLSLWKNIFYNFFIKSIFNRKVLISWQFLSILITIFLYGLFYISLLNQKE